MSPSTVGDLGEDALLRSIARRIGSPADGEVWAGDDAAVLRSPGDPSLWTTDALVEGVDFDLSYCSGFDIGWKAVACNVSDIAAMGGRPRHALATLFLAPTVVVSLVDDLLEGLLEAATRWGLSLVGGDISAADKLALSIALSGAPAHEAVLRSGARVGDAICVTGSLGGAAGGLFLLKNGLRDRSEELVRRQLRPQARAEEGVILATLGITSMIDVSDGFFLDLGRLLRAGAVGCEVDPGAVPVDPQLVCLEEIEDAPEPERLALSGGEDFELLFTIDPALLARAEDLLGEIGTAITRVGTVAARPRMVGTQALDAWEEIGWDHLKDR
jgi:thiamine-monophosphate kinase